jgi:MYXO-CTERM domain-containing protein
MPLRQPPVQAPSLSIGTIEVTVVPPPDPPRPPDARHSVAAASPAEPRPNAALAALGLAWFRFKG